MDTLQENEAMQNLPFREDGTVDPMELGRRQLEQMVNQIMDWQADELRGEGNRRDGHRERRLLAPVGEITPRIPKPREGSYFPDELIRPYSRVDRAMVAIAKEVYARGAVHPQDREGRGRAGLRLDKPLARLAYLDLPCEHHIRLRTDNVQERANEEIKRRAKVVGVFPSVASMKRLIGAVLVDVNEEWLSTSLIGAASLKGIERMRAEPEPIPEEVREKARILIAAAIDQRKAA